MMDGWTDGSISAAWNYFLLFFYLSKIRQPGSGLLIRIDGWMDG